MDAFESARQRAAELRGAIAKKEGNSFPLDLARLAVAELELDLYWLPVGDPALKGCRAIYDHQTGALCCEQTDDPIEAALLVSHEVGHSVLHAGSSTCGASDIDPTRSTEVAPVGLQRVEDYGAKERRELQADVFAREFLLPRSMAHRLHVDEHLGAAAIATIRALPINLVRQQLLDALLLKQSESPAEDQARTETQIEDESQKRAATHRGSAFLLQAGPGTGKTRTLVNRVLGLLAEGIDPASILVLTFSNRAAGELSERISKVMPDKAAKIWIGTFHAFGLDLVRRFHDRLGLPPDPILYDRSDSIEILDELLPTIPLTHYRNLWDPTMVICDLLAAISRAKDELVGAGPYRKLVEAMVTSAAALAADDPSRKAAEKCSEIADVYDLYENVLTNAKALDFGDLIMRPAMLLESDGIARNAVRLRHRYILVDEYQDMNRASARLLKAVAGEGRHLWVVGDARQAIYRFRGASAANMARFGTDYPGGATDQLAVNYRSTSEVVSVFSSCASKMKASNGMIPLKLAANRGASGGKPEVRRYDFAENEFAGIAANIRSLEAKGIPLRDQAVLCRGNERLNDVAVALEERGIAVLHLGSFFEREEVRDLLSLISLVVDSHGDGLTRVAAMPRYNISLQDVFTTTSALRESSLPPLQGLASVSESAYVSDKCRAALRLLANDLAGHTPASTAWEILTTYALDKTDLGRELASDRSVAGRMRAIAVWQLLNFIRDQSPISGGPPIRRTLDRVRRLVLLSEERDLRQVPATALNLNAVRLMTVHGSKGLEFEAVHIPGINVTAFPISYRGHRCPPVDGLIEFGPGEDSKTSHEAEEECLFFVALSRARTRLSLTLCKKQAGGKARNPSAFLSWLGTSTVVEVPDPQGLPATNPRPIVNQVAVVRSEPFHLSDSLLASYDKCARRFFYTHVLGLRGARAPTAYSKTQDCIFKIIDWLANSRSRSVLGLSDIETAFAEIWQKHGPNDHGLVAEYYKLAKGLLAALVTATANRKFREAMPLALDLTNGKVVVRPSEVSELADGTIIVRRIRPGHKRSDEYDKLEYTLYVSASKSSFGQSALVEAVHLGDGIVEQVDITDRKLANRRENVEALLRTIGDGSFPPTTSSRTCPRCPHFFYCPALPAGGLTV